MTRCEHVTQVLYLTSHGWTLFSERFLINAVSVLGRREDYTRRSAPGPAEKAFLKTARQRGTCECVRGVPFTLLRDRVGDGPPTAFGKPDASSVKKCLVGKPLLMSIFESLVTRGLVHPCGG